MWNRHAFPRSKMAAFQTYNKKHEIKNVVIWVQILQLCRCTIVLITWLYLNARKRVSKPNEKEKG